MFARLSVLISVCLLSAILVQAETRSASVEPRDGRCPVGVTRVTAQALRSHLVEVPPPLQAGPGLAAVDVQVDEEGRVCFVSLVSADTGLSEAAVAWVKQWRFSPFLLAGFPVQVTATIPLRFGQKQVARPASHAKTDDLCEKGSVCLYLKPDGALLRNREVLSATALEALNQVDGYILVRPDPRTPFAVVERTRASLREQTGRVVRFFSPYYSLLRSRTQGHRLVRVPGEFLDRNAMIDAARRMGYAVMRVELGVTFPEIGARQFLGSFTVNLAGDTRAATRMQSLTYQGSPGTLARPWPEEWLYEFDVDADGAVLFRAPKGDQPATELDKAVLRQSLKIVRPTPYPAPARVLLRLQLAR